MKPRCQCRKRGAFCHVHGVYNLSYLENEASARGAKKSDIPHGWQRCRGGKRIQRKELRSR